MYGLFKNSNSFISHYFTTFAIEKRNKSKHIIMKTSISEIRLQQTEDELSHIQEASLISTSLQEWRNEPQAINYGAIIICRRGEATLRINFKDWNLYEGAVITVFPNDIVSLLPNTSNSSCPFSADMLKYSASLLREASLQMEQTVYSSLRHDRCRQDSPVVTNIINCMFHLLRVYFDQSECRCISQLVLCQLKAFFIGFHDYMQRNPQHSADEAISHRVRELFNMFMSLMERNHKTCRDVAYYAKLMNITPKYLTNIVRQVTGHTPKNIIDQYVILQIKMALHSSHLSIKEIAWTYSFSDVSFFCRYFKKHTGLTPQQIRKQA